MPGISRTGTDSAGGVITGVLAPTVYVNGQPVSCLGAAVTGHGQAPHASPSMAESSQTVFAEGIGVCRSGDSASCGHGSSGSSDTFAGD